MTVIGLSVYIIAALFIVLWVYLTTKITVSVFSREKIIHRIILWPIVAWFLGLAMYLIFAIAGGLLGVIIEAFLGK